MIESTVVIGAGLSGLLVARQRLSHGEKVLVVEKSRGLGGRMATKRIDEIVLDQGAQFFTARSPAFQAIVDEWVEAGVAARWPGSNHRFVGQPSMTGIAKHLAIGLNVKREAKITAVRRIGGNWEVDVEEQPTITAKRLVMTAPVPQSLSLLAAGGVQLPNADAESLTQLVFHRCLSLLILLDGPSAVPVEGVTASNGPLRWVADNGKKGVGAKSPGAITVHASPDFSATHYMDDDAQVAKLLLPFVRQWFGGSKELSVVLHRWKFSEPVTQYSHPCLWLPELGLGMAGDAFGGPKMEGAALSGLALAEVLAQA